MLGWLELNFVIFFICLLWGNYNLMSWIISLES
jgi:hypothetical protein